MKKLFTRLCCALILLCVVGFLGGCALFKDPVITRDSFIGEWKQEGRPFLTYVFYENGSWQSYYVGGVRAHDGEWTWNGGNSATLTYRLKDGKSTATFKKHPEEGDFGYWLYISDEGFCKKVFKK